MKDRNNRIRLLLAASVTLLFSSCDRAAFEFTEGTAELAEGLGAGACRSGSSAGDVDGDGVADCEDSCPNDPNKVVPGLCGCGELELDMDGDSLCDTLELCAGDDATDDTDSDGTCNDIDLDDDGDGWPDSEEIACGSDPLDASAVPTDTDGDGIPDCLGASPTDYIALFHSCQWETSADIADIGPKKRTFG